MRGAGKGLASGRSFWRPFSCVALLVVASGPVSGQDDGPDPEWALEGQVGGSLFFGASDQSAVLIKTGMECECERVVFGAEAGFEYGEAQVLEGEPYVNKRSWSSAISLDYTPDGRVNPFVSMTAEGGLERQIDLRVSGGVGARYRIVRADDRRVDVSLSALLERTDPRAEGDDEGEVETLARWSARFRARRAMRDGGVVFDLVGFYRPTVTEPTRDYTVEVNSSLTFALTQQVGLKLSLADTYDSLAEDRGARDNNDGRLFFSLSATTR